MLVLTYLLISLVVVLPYGGHDHSQCSLHLPMEECPGWHGLSVHFITKTV